MARNDDGLQGTAWDPVSKQPYFKFAAVGVAKAGAHPITKVNAHVAAKVLDKASELTDKALSSAHPERARVADYIGTLTESNKQLVEACGRVATHHLDEPEIHFGIRMLTEFSNEALEKLGPFGNEYGEYEAKEPPPFVRRSSRRCAPDRSAFCAICTVSTSWRPKRT